MHWKSAILGAAVAAAAFMAAGRVSSGDDKPKAPPSPQEIAKFMKLAPQHEALKAYEGTWEGKGTVLEPGRPPTPFTATSTYTMVLEGRYLQVEQELKIGPVATIKSLAFIAFDNVRKKYVFFDMEDYTTQPVYAEGERDEAKKVLVLRGVDHLLPGLDRKFRNVTSDIVDDSFKVEAYSDDGTGEKKGVEATYKRQK